MSAPATEKFIAILKDAGYEPRSYSGRAMYGAQCVGVALSPGESLRIGARLAEIAVTLAVAELMKSAREDSMGRGVIVYWPNMLWPTSEVAL